MSDEPLDEDDFGFGPDEPLPGPDDPCRYALHNVVQALNWWTLLKSPPHVDEAREAMLRCLADARDALEAVVQRARDDGPGDGGEP